MVDSGLIGFDRSVVPNVRNEARIPGDHCTRDRAIRQMGWSKRVSRPKLDFEFHPFPFRFRPPLSGRPFSNQPRVQYKRIGKLAAFVSVKLTEPLAPTVTVPMTVQVMQSCVAMMSYV